MKITHTLRALRRRLAVISLTLIIPLSVLADETEIFYQNDASQVNSNVLFVLDASGSMDEPLPGGDGKDRMKGMQDAFREVLMEAPDNLNVGLMNYANADFTPSYQWDSVKGVVFPIADINSSAAGVIGTFSPVDNLPDPSPETPVRLFLSDVVDSWQHAGYTPIVDSLYEAARYFRGDSVVWGKYPPAYKWAAHPAAYSGSVSCENPRQEFCMPISDTSPCNGTQTNCQPIWVNDCCKDANGQCIAGANATDLGCGFFADQCMHTVCDGGTSGVANYNSPMEYTCQKNFMVLMSDGKPEYPYWIGVTADGTDRYAESAAPDKHHSPSIVPGLNPPIDSSTITQSIPAMIGQHCADSPNGYNSGTCGPELTRFLAEQDQHAGLEGDQHVETYTVAFGMGDEPRGTAYLASLATAEEGAFTAENTEQLVDAFKNIFNEIEKKSLSFSSPSFSVNEDTLLSHSNSVFLPVFDSNRSPLWSGNLRKFTLNDEGDIKGFNDTEVLNDDGTLTEMAQDLWSSQPHGADVKVGGAASKLPAPSNRKLRTDALGKTLVNIDTATTAITREMVSSGGSRRTEHGLLDLVDNTTDKYGVKDGLSSYGWYENCDGEIIRVVPSLSLPWTVLPNRTYEVGPVNIEEVTTCDGGLVSAERRDTLLNFARGYKNGVVDANDPGRKHIGDMLNTKPIVVNYGNTSLVLAATNEGYIHAFDANTGVEQWAFMPVGLLRNQDAFYRNEGDKTHIYGLDGALTLWKYDEDKNGVFEPDVSNDKMYLFFGMRRGGRMYYALDITTANNPKVAWKIGPETAIGVDTEGYANLGETWSKPTLSKMRVPSSGNALGDLKHVLVFGGGYDPRKDEVDPASRSSLSGVSELGSDVYIVDALTGKRLWSVKNNLQDSVISDFKHSVPGDIRVLDMDNNGELDRLYFADTGGYVWRVDMGLEVDGQTATLKTNARITMLADLGAGDNTESIGETRDLDRRKFFYEPDTALRLANGRPILTVSLGSGYRTHPLDLGDNDQFFVLIDEHVYEQRPDSPSKVITLNQLKPRSDIEDDKTILDYPDKKGWHHDFPYLGEKVLATSLTFLDKIIFTTFAQADENGDESIVASCSPAVTTARAYVLDLLSGRPVANLDRAQYQDNGETMTTDDMYVVAGKYEILDSPQLIFSKLQNSQKGACTKLDCQQSVSVRIGKLKLPLLDLDNTRNEDDSNYSEMVDLTKLLPRLYWRDNGLEGKTALQGESGD